MAKLLLSLAALFLLFAFSHARTSSDLPANEIKARDPADAKLPESNPKPKTRTTTTILLPSEKPDTESTTGATILPKEESTIETVPLTVFSFRPVNRHFPRRPFPLSFRHGRPCRHGRRPWTPRFHGGEREHREGESVSYGNDIIMASGDNMGFDPAVRGGERQIPARWVNFRHGGPRFPFRHEEEMELERPHHHDHHHDHDQDRREGFEGMEKPFREHKHEHEGGLMRKFRKFLNHF